MEQEAPHKKQKQKFPKRYLCHKNPLISCLAWLLLIFFTFIVLLGLLVLIMYLALHPKPPKISIQGFSVRRLSTSFASRSLDANLGLDLNIQNPNAKLKILFDDINLQVFFDDLEIGKSSIASFKQAKHSLIDGLRKDVSSDGLSLPKGVVSSLLKSLAQKKITFQVVLKVNFRFQLGALKTPRFRFSEKCVLDVRPFAGFSRDSSFLNKDCGSHIRL